MKVINPQKDFCEWLHYIETYRKGGVKVQLMLSNLRMILSFWHIIGDVNKFSQWKVIGNIG